MKKVPIVIPSYEPEERLLSLCEDLYVANLKDVVIVQMFISGLLVTLLVNQLMINETIIKVCVDTVLFFISFFIQKNLFLMINRGGFND